MGKCLKMTMRKTLFKPIYIMCTLGSWNALQMKIQIWIIVFIDTPVILHCMRCSLRMLLTGPYKRAGSNNIQPCLIFHTYVNTSLTVTECTVCHSPKLALYLFQHQKRIHKAKHKTVAIGVAAPWRLWGQGVSPRSKGDNLVHIKGGEMTIEST